MRCRLSGYQYSEIIRSLMSVYFCGGSCIEDVTTHLMYHLSLHPTLRSCSADTILRAIKELTQDNISYTSDTGKTYTSTRQTQPPHNCENAAICSSDPLAGVILRGVHIEVGVGIPRH